MYMKLKFIVLTSLKCINHIRVLVQTSPPTHLQKLLIFLNSDSVLIPAPFPPNPRQPLLCLLCLRIGVELYST